MRAELCAQLVQIDAVLTTIMGRDVLIRDTPIRRGSDRRIPLNELLAFLEDGPQSQSAILAHFGCTHPNARTGLNRYVTSGKITRRGLLYDVVAA